MDTFNTKLKRKTNIARLFKSAQHMRFKLSSRRNIENANEEI